MEYLIQPQPIPNYDPGYHVAPTYNAICVASWGKAYIGYIHNGAWVGYEGDDAQWVEAPSDWRAAIIQPLPLN